MNNNPDADLQARQDADLQARQDAAHRTARRMTRPIEKCIYIPEKCAEQPTPCIEAGSCMGHYQLQFDMAMRRLAIPAPQSHAQTPTTRPQSGGTPLAFICNSPDY